MGYHRWFAVFSCAILATWVAATYAGNPNNFGRQAVGGVAVDPQGVVANSTVDELNKLRQLRTEAQTAVPEGLGDKTQLRKISLKRLAAEIKKHVEADKKLPDDIRYLSGLQRIKYVFVYPEENDIVLAGPAEGWKVDDLGNVCGKTTGAPVIHLEDLLVALRSADQLAAGRVTCSIDPSQEGMARLLTWIKAQDGRLNNDAKTTATTVEQTLGPQNITFSGVDASTRFARVLFAADFRMKRIAMGFDRSPVTGVKSFLEMTAGGDMFPRWWLTTNYESLLKSEDGLAWEIRGQGVKAMTESSFFQANGARDANGKANPIAQKWADDMTKHYGALADASPIFSELRNVMDLAVVVALIQKEDLAGKAGLDLAAFKSPTIPTTQLNAPKTVPTQASFIKKASKTILSASGGVEIKPNVALEKVEMSKTLAPVRKEATADATNWQWWWN
jgi:hypothetical protein